MVRLTNTRLWWGIALAALALLLAGCGVTTAGGNDCANLTSSPPTSAGTSVVIATDHTAYASDGAIKVTVTNHLTTAIYAWDHQANCSILGLEVEKQGVWGPAPQTVAGCPLGRVTLQVQIAPGQSYTATIHAGYVHPGVFAPGSYRLVLSYTTTRSPDAAATAASYTTIYSQTLTIVDCGVGTPSSVSTPAMGVGTVAAGTPITITPAP